MRNYFLLFLKTIILSVCCCFLHFFIVLSFIIKALLANILVFCASPFRLCLIHSWLSTLPILPLWIIRYIVAVEGTFSFFSVTLFAICSPRPVLFYLFFFHIAYFRKYIYKIGEILTSWYHIFSHAVHRKIFYVSFSFSHNNTITFYFSF